MPAARYAAKSSSRERPTVGQCLDGGVARTTEQGGVDAELGRAAGDAPQGPLGGEGQQQPEVVRAHRVEGPAHRPRPDEFPAVEGSADVPTRGAGRPDTDRPEDLAEVLPLHGGHPLDHGGGTEPRHGDALRGEAHRPELRGRGRHHPSMARTTVTRPRR
nr:hypothetical protein [Curtobacterium sp. UNCCL20]